MLVYENLGCLIKLLEATLQIYNYETVFLQIKQKILILQIWSHLNDIISLVSASIKLRFS